jgi:hypothetical protein
MRCCTSWRLQCSCLQATLRFALRKTTKSANSALLECTSARVAEIYYVFICGNNFPRIYGAWQHIVFDSSQHDVEPMVCRRAILLSKAEAAEASTTRVRLSTESSLPGPHQLPPPCINCTRVWCLTPVPVTCTELRGYQLSRLCLYNFRPVRKNSSCPRAIHRVSRHMLDR